MVGIDEAFAALQPRAQHIVEGLHDRAVGLGLRDVVDADRAHQLAVDEDAEPVAVGRIIQIVRDHLVAGFVDKAVQPVGLVAKAVDGLEILAAFAAPVFGALEQLFYFAGERRCLRGRVFAVSARHSAKRRQLRNHTQPHSPPPNEGTAIVKYVKF